MTMPWLALLLALSLPSGDPTGTPQAEESVLTTYDLRAVMPRWDSGTNWAQSLLMPPAISPRQGMESVDTSLDYDELASFELLDLLTQILGDELRREGRDLVAEGTGLTALAPAALQEQIAGILESLQAALAGTVTVRVDLIDLAEGSGELPPAGVLAAEEAAGLASALVSRGAQLKSFTLELSAGRTARVDAYRRVPFLFDYDVEIAQAMMIFAPVMSTTREGTRLVMRGIAVPGGLALSSVILRSDLLGAIGKRGFTLNGVINDPEKGEMRVVAGPDGIQAPEVLVRGFSFDTFLPDGKALALTAEGTLGPAKSRQLVLLRRMGGTMNSYVARPIPRTSRTLIALDTELFHGGKLRASYEPWNDESGDMQPDVVGRFDGEPSSFLLEWMKARFSVWRRFGPWILIVTDPAWDRDAAAQLERLVKSLRPATTLRLASVDLRSAGREPGYPVRVRLPMLDGSSAGIVLAHGKTAVTGFDVEVAQGASVPDPVVTSVFDGLALALDLQGSTLEARGMGQLFDGPMLTVETGYDLFGPIDRPEPRVLRFDERVLLPEGRPGPVRFGGTAERSDQPGLALEITVTPLAR